MRAGREMAGWKSMVRMEEEGERRWRAKEGGGWNTHRGGRGSTLAARDPDGSSVNPRGHVTSIFGCSKSQIHARPANYSAIALHTMLIRDRSSNEWRSIEIRTSIRLYCSFYPWSFHGDSFRRVMFIRVYGEIRSVDR